jgi:3-methyladenine DNA glycosylase AlkC
MSDEKDAILGRVMRESRENNDHVERLRAECTRIGNRLAGVAHGLEHHPEGVALDDQVLEESRFNYHRVSLLSGDLNLDKISQLTNEYRQALIRKDTLDNQLKELGFPK